MPAGCVIGVDLGGTKLLAGVVGEDLAVHHRALRPVEGVDQATLLDMIVGAVAEARAAAPQEVAAVGCGIACLMDYERGIAVSSSHLPLERLAFRDVMTERLGLPVLVDNDGNATALAEHRFGAAHGARDAVVLTLGTGIASGLIIGGRLARGATGAGAEIGHMVIERDGPPCPSSCPNRGCLEAVASGRALERGARALAEQRPESELGRALAEGRELSGGAVTELAHDGDEAALQAVREIGEALGVGLVNVVNVLEPEVIAIGGGVMAAGELLLEPARAVVARRALPPCAEHVRIVPARFGADAGMIGAAALAFDSLGASGRRAA